MRDGGDGTLVADCRLIGRRTLPGQGEQETVHFTGRVRLAREAPPAPARRTRRRTLGGRAAVEHDAVYRVYFHGPAYQVLERAYRSDGDVRRPARRRPACRPRAAAEDRREIAPRLIELCFQTAGVWELGTDGRMAPADPRGPRAALRRRGRRAASTPSSSRAETAPASMPRWSTRAGRARPARGLPHHRAARSARERGARSDLRAVG